jgi:SAM-dependent methyltransferase
MADQAVQHEEQVRLLFDAKARSWPAKYAPDGRLAGRLAQLAEVAGHHLSAGGKVLDLGCGTGDLARHLSYTGYRVTGCDISENMLAQASVSDPAREIEWVLLNADWQALPFASCSFDAVIAASVLEYVRSPEFVLPECARVLRPGAVMLCTVPDPSHPVRRLEGLAGFVAKVPAVRATGRRWPRLDRYLTYLRISRQRHPADWWYAAFAQVGLLTVPSPTEQVTRAPLRLLTFHRPKDPGECS